MKIVFNFKPQLIVFGGKCSNYINSIPQLTCFTVRQVSYRVISDIVW